MSLSDFVQPVEPKPAAGEGVVESVDLSVDHEAVDSVEFILQYNLRGKETCAVQEHYVVNPDAVDGTWNLGVPDLTQTRVIFPALVNDGANDLAVATKRGLLEVHRGGCVMYWEVTKPDNVLLRQEGPRVPSHNGYMRAVIGEISRTRAPVSWHLTLEKDRE
jgi:hypothetical protein